MTATDAPLAGRIVLVAGASRGLGRACAIEFGAGGQRFSGHVVDVGELAIAYGVTDLDGTQPQPNAGRFEPTRPLPPYES